jgi:hypothetical protein
MIGHAGDLVRFGLGAAKRDSLSLAQISGAYPASSAALTTI